MEYFNERERLIEQKKPPTVKSLKGQEKTHCSIVVGHSFFDVDF